MPIALPPHHRRADREMAQHVQHGLSLLYREGATEARRYMSVCGISDQTIARVLSARLVRGARTPVCTVV